MGKFPDCYYVTSSVKEDENGGHGHSLASLLHVETRRTWGLDVEPQAVFL
jgi:hypothetical protein